MPRIGTPAPPVFGDPGGDPCVYGVVGDEGCEAEIEAGSIVVPAPLYWATVQHLDRWAQYPRECSGALGDCHEAWHEVVKALAEVEAARLAEQSLERTQGWEPWRERLYLILGIAAGVLVGTGVGALVAVFQ